MKKNVTNIGLTVITAFLAASCARESAPVAAGSQPGAAPEPVVIRESAFRPAQTQGSSTTQPAPAPVQQPTAAQEATAIKTIPITPSRATASGPTASGGPMTVTLATGTVLAVRVGETLTSEKNQSGDSWTGVLAEPVVVNGLVIAERGAEVVGRVENVKRSGKVKGVGTISVTLSRLATADRQRVAINTTSFSAVARDDTKRDVGKVAIVSGIGAAIGAIAGGGRGAAIGAGAGAGAGTGVVMATRGKPAIIATETLIRFRIAAPVTITENLK